MKKIAVVVIILGLVVVFLWRLQYKPVSSIGVESGQIQKDTSEDLEKCTCGACKLDIFSCTCPTAKSQREALKKEEK